MNSTSSLVPVVAAFLVFVTLALETWRASSNERWLLERGARIVPDPSFPWMRIAYPLGFLLVVGEGWWRGVHWGRWVAVGVAVFLVGKVIKYAAIAALGRRWSFRILVQPGELLVAHGIYAVLRHPNYAGVAAEVVGIAVWMQAPITGTLFAVTFGLILRWRIRLEEHALGLAPRL